LISQRSSTFKRKRLHSNGRQDDQDVERPSLIETDFIYEHEGPLEDLQEVVTDEELTYFVFKCLKVTQSTLIKLSTVSLILGLAMERYCFIVIVYKVKYYGYVLILIVIFFNFIFNLAKMYLSTRKVEGDTEHLWEAFRLNKK